MKVSDLIEQLSPYSDFDLYVNIHLKVVDEELQQRSYGYPYDNLN